MLEKIDQFLYIQEGKNQQTAVLNSILPCLFSNINSFDLLFFTFRTNLSAVFVPIVDRFLHPSVNPRSSYGTFLKEVALNDHDVGTRLTLAIICAHLVT